MSNKLEVISRHYRLPKTLTGKGITKALLKVLCCYADNNGSCFPSLLTLSEEMEVAKKTIIEKLKVLESVGVVSVTRKSSGNGRDAVNIYVVSESVMLASILEDKGVLNKHIVSVCNGLPLVTHTDNEPSRSLYELREVTSKDYEGLPMSYEGLPMSYEGLPESLINHQLITKEDIGSGSNKNSTINSSSSESLILRDANTEQLNIWFNLRAFTKSEPSQKNVVINSMPRTSDLDLIDWVDEIANECECVLTNREHCFRFCQAALIELNTKNNNQADTVNIFYRLKLIDDATSHEEGSFPSWPERLGQWL